MVFCDANFINHGTIKRLNEVQQQFRNSIAMVMNIADDEEWTQFQMLIEYSTLRLFRVSDVPQAASIAMQCYTELSNKEKFARQAAYFKNEQERMVSGDAARVVISETFHRLAIPDEDAAIMMDGYPTIQRLATATEQEMGLDCPASLESIKKITEFFQD